MVNSAASLISSASYSLYALNQNVNQVSLSTARLSSGNRIIRPADDVAALSVSQGLRYEIKALRQALQNSTQADSLLQVAYGGLQGISDILDNMKSLAVQSNSGSLTNSDRAFLQVEFQNYIDEIDRIANGTSFNDIKLLDGSLAEENLVENTDTNAAAASATLTFTVNIGAGQTVNINNVALTEGVNFAAGGTTDVSVANLATAINNSTNAAFSGIRATANLNNLTLTARTAGEAGEANIVDRAASTATFVTAGDTTAQANVFSFAGGDDNGLRANSVRVSGTSANGLVAAQNIQQGYTQLTLTALPVDGEQFRIDNSNGGLLNFTFRNAPATATEVQIGADAQESLQNLVDTIRNYTGNEEYVIDQLEFVQDGDTLTIRNLTPGNAVDLNSANIDFGETLTNGTLTSATMSNGATGGVNTAGVTNKDFIGDVSGFSATYNSANNITASLTVGSFTYTGNITNTAPGANATVRFTSTTSGGGYFDVQLAGGGGMAVANQTNADTYATTLDASFAGLTFSQNRVSESFSGINDLVGASFEMQLGDFTEVNMTRVDVTAPATPGSSARIEFDVNGETFRSSTNLGDSIGANAIVEFIGDNGNLLTLKTGAQVIDLSTDTAAATFEDTLEDSFGLGSANAAAEFQVGANPANKLSIIIGSATSEKLFDGDDISVDTQVNAGIADTALDGAINEVTSLISRVGSYQAIAQSVQNSLSSEIVSKDEARASLADTDIAEESTNFAMATVRTRSAVSVLAQIPNLYNAFLQLVDNDN